MPIPGSGLPTISDVAKLAGVSVPTVSRVINGKVPVSPQKQELVKKAIAELGYRPLVAARALASQSTKTIGALTSNTRRHGYIETLEGIEIGAKELEYSTLIHLMQRSDGETVSDLVSNILAQKVDGIVVLAFDELAESVLEALPDSLPTSIAGSGGNSSGFPRSYVDEYAAAYELVTALIRDGHKTVKHISLPEVTRTQDARTRAWRDALDDHGCEIPDPLSGGWDAETGYQMGLQLSRDSDTTAVFCGNDEIAIGLIAGLREKGKRIPEDVSVVGFDNHALSRYISPPLTTAHLDFVEMGRRAASLVIHQIALAGNDKETLDRINYSQALEPVVAEVIFRKSNSRKS